MKKIRIGILGIGGTGGFFGGKLAKHYKDDAAVEVVFIARNETKRKILQDGLIVESVEGDYTVKPDVVTDQNAEVGALDILLVCVKSYGLEEAINRYKENVKEEGVIITIQNVVNQAERIEKLLPDTVVLLEGCAYIISNIAEAGHIKHKGGPATLIFGRNENVKKFEWINNLFLEAGIKATLTDNIEYTLWKKFLFISPIGVATSYFNCTMGELRNDPERLLFAKGLMNELFELIQIKNIPIPTEQVEEHLEFLMKLPENGKTSLQLDIENGKASEVDSLLDYIIDESKKLGLALTNYPMAQERLSSSDN